MLTFFPSLYEDELLYSAISRFKERAGILSTQAFLKELYGSRLPTHSIQLPIHIDQLIGHMPPYCLLTAEKVIYEHTMFPLYTAFLNKERTDSIYNTMREDKTTCIDAKVGILTSKIMPYTHLRYCKECLKEDMQKYGESYWRRTHQVPGVLICPEHLRSFSNSKVLANNLRREYVSPNEVVCFTEGRETMYSEKVLKYNLKYIKGVQTLLRQKFIRREGEHFKACYMQVLKERGFMAEGGTVKMQGLAEQFISYYTPEYLEIMQSSVEGGKETDWLKLHIRNTVKSKHPLRHLLLVQFLEVEIEDMFNMAPIVLPKKTAKVHTPIKNIEEQRAKWTQVVQDNPNCNRSQLKRIGGAVYTWIVKYDREWYETVTPKNRAHKERIDVIRHVLRDEELLKRAEMAVHMLSNTQQKPIRITESAIKREVGITLKLNASEFEKTYKYTQEHIESLEKFRIRKIQWAISELLKEEQEISAYKIECKAGFGGKDLQEVRPLVEEILRQYS